MDEADRRFIETQRRHLKGALKQLDEYEDSLREKERKNENRNPSTPPATPR